MPLFSLSNVTQLYDFCRASVSVEEVHNELFLETARLIRVLERQLGDRRQDEIWSQVLPPIKRYLFNISSSPVPFNYLADEKWFQDLEPNITILRLIYSDTKEILDVLSKRLADFATSNGNPLMTRLKEMSTHWPRKAALLIKESRLIVSTTKVLSEAGIDLSVLVPQTLKGYAAYQTLLLIGAYRWFPTYVFSAPRAEAIKIIKYSGFNESLSLKSAFAKPIRRMTKNFIQKVLPPMENDFYLKPEELMPSIDWDRAAKRALANIPSSEEDDEVLARLVVLRNDKGVFLDDDSKSLVLLLDEQTQVDLGSISNVRVSKLDSNMALLFRTRGGGDLIIPVADRMLGDRVSDYRKLQKRWKSLLREKVRAKDTNGVCQLLTLYGATKASQENVRGWMNEQTIRPQSDEDFFAIMKLLQLDAEFEKFLTAANSIRSAHQRAGQYIRRLLLYEAQRVNLSCLNRLGSLDIQLPAEDGGSLTAFVVESIGPKRTIPASQLGHVFDGDEEQWLE